MSKFACIKCRKIFKKPKFKQDRRGQWDEVVYNVICPECSSDMYETGSALKAPKTTDTKAWGQLEPLFRNGYKFHPDSGNPFEYEPETPNTNNKRSMVPQSEFRKPARKRNK